MAVEGCCSWGAARAGAAAWPPAGSGLRVTISFSLRLGTTLPKVSAIRHYRLAGFSVERLMNLLTALDQDVETVIRRKPRSRKAGRISVVAA